MSSKPNVGGPSPKKLKTDPKLRNAVKSSPRKTPDTSQPSPKKFSPRKYYAPRRYSPRKASKAKTGGDGDEKAASASERSCLGEMELAQRTHSEGYYSVNFKEVLSKCLLPSNPERHVISDREVALVGEFMKLGVSCQQLYVRLFLRKHHWIRTAKLTYNDIAPNLNPILKDLHEKKFLLNECDLKDPSVVLGLLQVGELKSLCKVFHMPVSVVASSKLKMIDALFKQDRDHKPLFGKGQFMSSVVAKGKAALGGCVRLSEEPVETFSKLMLLFSITNAWLNRDEDNDFSQVIYRMLQVNIGQLVYPEYQVVITQPLFKDKECFENYYQALKEEQRLQQALEESEHNVADMILKNIRRLLQEDLDSRSVDCSMPQFFLPFTPGHVYVRVISRGVEYLEKCGKYQQANQLLEQLLAQGTYSRRRRGRWWDRWALNWDFHLKDKRKCLEVVKEGLLDPHLTPALRLSLVQRARRILQAKAPRKRKLFAGSDGVVRPPRKRKFEPESSSDGGASSGTERGYTLEDFPEEELLQAPEVVIEGKQLHADSKPFFVTRPRTTGEGPSTGDHALLGVEGYAINHYIKEKGWPCAVHAENSTFSTLFALLMWEVLFAAIPDVFRAPCQNAPLDLFCDDCFYSSRKEMVDSKLSHIRAADEKEISRLIEECWESHFGQVCVGVDWSLFPDAVNDAKDVAVCLGGEVLAHVCELYCQSYRSNCSGLPDLTLWNPATRKCMFVEVKGPGDKLSNKQIVWLSRLAGWGCAVEVCRVRAS